MSELLANFLDVKRLWKTNYGAFTVSCTLKILFEVYWYSGTSCICSIFYCPMLGILQPEVCFIFLTLVRTLVFICSMIFLSDLRDFPQLLPVSGFLPSIFLHFLLVTPWALRTYWRQIWLMFATNTHRARFRISDHVFKISVALGHLSPSHVSWEISGLALQ